MDVFVTNCTDTGLVDRFAGVDYKFPINVLVQVPVAVAEHIFGYGDENKLPYLVRLNFTKDSTDVGQALERLARFKISRSAAQDRKPSAVGVVPLPVKKAGAGGTVS